MPHFVLVAAPIAALARGENCIFNQSINQSINQSPSRFDAPGTKAFSLELLLLPLLYSLHNLNIIQKSKVPTFHAQQQTDTQTVPISHNLLQQSL